MHVRKHTSHEHPLSYSNFGYGEGKQERVEDYVDLYHTVGSLMLKLGKAKNAVQFLEGVMQVWSVEENVTIAHELAEAQTLAGSHEAAEAVYKYENAFGCIVLFNSNIFLNTFIESERGVGHSDFIFSRWPGRFSRASHKTLPRSLAYRLSSRPVNKTLQRAIATVSIKYKATRRR